MHVLNKQITVYCDIDDTLIMWDGETWHSNDAHIIKLKQFKYQGFGLIAWSAGGSEWAARALELLGLTDLFDIVMSKPNWFFDDKKAVDFMPESNRIYLESVKTPNEYRFDYYLSKDGTDMTIYGDKS